MAAAPHTLPRLDPGTLVGPWRLLVHLDDGGFGDVYKAELASHPGSEPFALKLARFQSDKRFEREALILSRLHHPNVPRYKDHGLYSDSLGRQFPYIVMQFVHGLTLYAWARQRRLSSRQVLALVAQVARALEATHPHGLHRDVKGHNVLVDSLGHAMLVDFGACWMPEAHSVTDSVVPPGTENYRSHQILRFRFLHRWHDHARYRSQPDDDLYALGVLLACLVTGRYPPPATDPESEEPPPARKRLKPSDEATVIPLVDEVVARLMSEDRQTRGEAGALAKELELAVATLGPEADAPVGPTPSAMLTQHTSHPGPRLPPLWRAEYTLAALLAVALVGVGALVSYRLVDSLAELMAPHEGKEPQEGGVDGGSADVGSTTLASASPPSKQAHSTAAVAGSQVPDEPLKGQQQPPCDSKDIEINGGCWVPSSLRPPCPRDWYAWKDYCYFPIMASQRVPTSEE